ncbi:MAG: hypothetical protein OXN18_03160, partial [Gemmatimonadota bacterium]|nr:hypothetical protein [Gemmatimonadota bacterium]
MSPSGAWRRCLRLLSSPPESSRPAAGRSPSRRRGLAAALLVLPLLAGLAPGAAAQTPVPNSDGSYTVPEDWALKPSGLNDGDKFRLLFITDSWRDATSASISTYNSHVQTEAANGALAIRPYSAQFKVVGSTSGIDARDNVGATGTGVPIYWMGGSKVADNYTDFWDGSWDNNADSDRQSAGGFQANSSTQNDWPWTGTNNNGTKHSNPLGSATPRRGAFGSNSPLSQQSGAPSSQTHAFYGLSPVFVVGTTQQAAVKVSFDQLATTVSEPHGVAVVRGSLSAAQAAPFTISLEYQDTNAVQGEDYQPVDSIT